MWKANGNKSVERCQSRAEWEVIEAFYTILGKGGVSAADNMPMGRQQAMLDKLHVSQIDGLLLWK